MLKVLSFWAVIGMALILLKEQNLDHQVSAVYRRNEEALQKEETILFVGSMTRNMEVVRGNRIQNYYRIHSYAIIALTSQLHYFAD